MGGVDKTLRDAAGIVGEEGVWDLNKEYFDHIEKMQRDMSDHMAQKVFAQQQAIGRASGLAMSDGSGAAQWNTQIWGGIDWDTLAVKGTSLPWQAKTWMEEKMGPIKIKGGFTAENFEGKTAAECAEIANRIYEAIERMKPGEKK